MKCCRSAFFPCVYMRVSLLLPVYTPMVFTVYLCDVFFFLDFLSMFDSFICGYSHLFAQLETVNP